jgi:DNA (cytosine-5)-methyltransferase 1
MFRVIRQARPAYVVAENVRGLVSWNEGLVLDTVCADLEGEGYEVFPVVLPAASVNAPHRRDRIWIVAHANDKGRNGEPRQVQGTHGEVPQRDHDAEPCHAGATNASNANGQQCADGDGKGTPCKPTQPAHGIESPHGAGKWETFPTVTPVCGGNDGLPKRLDGITFSKWRRESIKAYGNAIVPQVALQIFRAIEQDVQGSL